MTPPEVPNERISFHDAPPPTVGGIPARQGFTYQDDVAVKFLIEMLTNPDLLKVVCESQDDIDLVRSIGGLEIIEFVQVKNTHPEKLWDLKLLCERERDRNRNAIIGSSLLEKSLAHDEYIQTSWFRIVTSRQIHSNIKILTWPRPHLDRVMTNEEFSVLNTSIAAVLNGVSSKNKNGSSYWILNTQWEVLDDGSIIPVNQQHLSKALHKHGHPNDPETVDHVYGQLRALAKSRAEYGVPMWRDKPISRQELLALVANWINPSPDGDQVERMETKMKAAGLDQVCIEAAKIERRRYRQRRLDPGFLNLQDAEDFDLKILHKLHNLRSDLDSGLNLANGTKFHRECLQEVQQVDLTVDGSYAAGCMYFITGNCWHRFVRM